MIANYIIATVVVFGYLLTGIGWGLGARAEEMSIWSFLYTVLFWPMWKGMADATESRWR